MSKTPVDYQLLAIFAAVAEESSFSNAARKLGLGKGTVSRAIARLEALLGAELIHRTTHTVALSTAGIALYERSARHLAALDEAVHKLPERAEQPSGQLRITAPHDFGVIVLPEVLSQFSRRYPDIRLDLRLSNERVDLVAQGFDLAIRVAARMKDSSLTARRIGGGAVRAYAAPSYVGRRGKPRQLGDPTHDWVMHPGVLGLWKPPRAATWRILCDDLFCIRELVRDGAGVGVLPRFLAEPYVRDGLLESVTLAEWPQPKASFFLVYPSSGQVPRKVVAFRDFLVERLKTAPIE
jgi:DNA-binding transcriptional LysR family regulator